MSDINVIQADGSPGHVDESLLPSIVESGGRIATPEDIHAAELHEKYGGIGGQAAAFGAGAVDGATFGLGTAAAAQFGLAPTIQDLRTENPNAFTAGNVTGAIVPVLASGGSGAVAKGAATLGAPALGVARAGEAAAGLVRGAGLLREGSLAARAVPLAVQGAVEGAAFGMGHEITEAALVPNAELTAEKLLAGAVHGAGWGLAGGAVFGGLEHLASKAATKTGELVSRAGGASSASEYIERLGNEQLVKAVGGGKRFVREVETIPGGTEALANRMRTEGEELLGKRVAKWTREDLGELSEKGMARYDVGKVLEEFEPVVQAAGVAPKVADVTARMQKIADELGANFSTVTAAKRVEGFIEHLAEKYGDDAAATLTLKDLHGLRKEADTLVNWGKKGQGELLPLSGLRREINDIIVETGTKASEVSGSPLFSEAWKKVNEGFQAYKVLSKGAKSGIEGQISNRFFSLTDNIAGAAASVVGHATFGPLGALAGAGVAAVGNHYARTHGGFIAADIASQVAQKLRGVGVVANTVDTRIANGLRGFMAKAETTAVRGETEALNKRFERKTAAVRAIAADPMKQSAYVMARVGRIEDAAPATMAAAQRAAVRTTEYLASTMPKPRVPKGSIMPRSQAVPPTSTEMSAWLRRERAANDPLSLVDDMRKGTLTPESVDAVKATSPALFEQVRRQALAYVEERDIAGKPLEYGQRVQLGILFNVPTDATLEPEFIRSIQETYPAAGALESNGNSAPSGTGRPIRLQTSAASASEAIEGR